MKQTYNVQYDRYTATINGRQYKTVFHFHDIKRISETFLNVTWTRVQEVQG